MVVMAGVVISPIKNLHRSLIQGHSKTSHHLLQMRLQYHINGTVCANAPSLILIGRQQSLTPPTEAVEQRMSENIQHFLPGPS